MVQLRDTFPTIPCYNSLKYTLTMDVLGELNRVAAQLCCQFAPVAIYGTAAKKNPVWAKKHFPHISLLLKKSLLTRHLRLQGQLLPLVS